MIGRPQIVLPVLPCAVVLALGVLLACWLGANGFPSPRGDDAVYKSPAAELAQHGRLAIPCMSGFLPRAEVAFACYPPLYPLLLGAWYLVFGVSLGSTLAFTYTVHMLGALALMLVVDRLLERSLGLSIATRRAIVVAVGLIQLGNLAYFDRQEETALLWVWLEILAVHGTATRPGIARAALSGLLVGLAALTSPWVGLLGAMVVALRAVVTAIVPCETGGALLQRAQIEQTQSPNLPLVSIPALSGGRDARAPSSVQALGVHLAAVAIVAAGVGGVWYFTIESLYPGIVREQLFGTVNFLKDERAATAAGNLQVFARTALYNPPQLPATVLVLVLFPLALAARGWRAVAPLATAIYFAAVAGMVAVLVIRPGAYTYLGAAQFLLLACTGTAVERYFALHKGTVPFSSNENWDSPPSGLACLAWLPLALCVVVAGKDAAVLGAATIRTPPNERPKAVFAHLHEVIPPGDLVAVTAAHWYAFQGRNPWREAYFSSLIDSREARRGRWLVLPQNIGRPEFIDAFQLVEEVPTAAVGYRTYAYSLWRRKEVGPLFPAENTKDNHHARKHNPPAATARRNAAERGPAGLQ